jgi:hypothetical protein
MAYNWSPTATGTASTTGRHTVPPPSAAAPPEEATLAEVVEAFAAAAEDGTVRNRTGRRYRPSARRDVVGSLRTHVVPELGALRLRDVQWEDLQRLVDDLAATELSLSRIRSVVSAIRALYGYAIDQGIVAVSAADHLEIARVEQPLWEDDPPEADPHGDERLSWADAADREWEERTAARRREETEEWQRQGGEGTPRPLSQLLLSLVLRLLVAVFLIIALVSLAQSLLLPA